MATTGARRRPQKYPDELRERAVRMVLEIRRETDEKHTTITRVARELGVGAESLRHWVNQAEVDSGVSPGFRRRTPSGSLSSNARTVSFAEPTTS